MYRKVFILLAAFLTLASCTSEKDPVVNYKLYLDWPERKLPDFSKLGDPDITGIKNNFDLVDIDETLNHYALLMETTLKVRQKRNIPSRPPPTMVPSSISTANSFSTTMEPTGR